jgi:hypothetical protein
MSALGSVRGRRGESPLQAYALRSVTERNCVTARWGGEQREVKNQSVELTNAIRPIVAASLLINGEARTSLKEEVCHAEG